MKCTGIFLGLLLSVGLAVAQEKSVPDIWLGVWKLNLAKSKFDERAPFTVSGQTLTITATQKELTLTGETTLSDGRHFSEVSKVPLDGKEVSIAKDITAIFKRVDDRAFEITVTANTAVGKGIGVNHFVFSSDGKTLTETKTQTLKPNVSGTDDATKEAQVKTTSSVLFFQKQEPGK